MPIFVAFEAKYNLIQCLAVFLRVLNELVEYHWIAYHSTHFLGQSSYVTLLIFGSEDFIELLRLVPIDEWIQFVRKVIFQLLAHTFPLLL